MKRKWLLKNESNYSVTGKYFRLILHPSDCYTDLVVLAAIYGFSSSQYLSSHCRNMR